MNYLILAVKQLYRREKQLISRATVYIHPSEYSMFAFGLNFWYFPGVWFEFDKCILSVNIADLDWVKATKISTTVSRTAETSKSKLGHLYIFPKKFFLSLWVFTETTFSNLLSHWSINVHLVFHVISRDGSNLLLDVNYLLLCHRLAGSSQPVLNVTHND